jgi:pyrrolidone-carboxylate peptidase
VKGLLSLALAASAACSRDESGSQVLTDLGPTGNARVASTFASYKAKGYGCSAYGYGKRAIVTGFGLFEGAAYNISGTVVGALGNKTFTPWDVSLASTPASSMQPLSYWGFLRNEDYGGRAVNRTIRIDGEYVSVCFLTLDVIWDLAASIIVHEMQRFQPDLVLMSGRGGSYAGVEYGAVNSATQYSGFAASGARIPDNTPVGYDAKILENGPDTLTMTWPQAAMASAMRGQLRGLSYQVYTEDEARPENDYICNNVSYVALAAAQGLPISLAGGRIPTVTLSLHSQPKIGFFHYPSSAGRSASELTAWSRGILAMVKAGVR